MAKPKVLIAGSWNFSNYELLEKQCDYYLQRFTKYGGSIEVVNGRHGGADMHARQYAYNKMFNYKSFKITPNKFMQNMSAMLDYIDCAIIFWDGQTRGAKYLISACKSRRIKHRVVNYIPTIAD